MAISDALAVAKRGGFSVARREAERSFGRFRAGIWPVVQTALAAALAWSAAALVLGHDRPFVAAIAAVISIGAVAGQTLKRAAEWILGIAVGLAVADLILLAIGTGPVQTGIIVGLAMSVALVIRGGIMFWTETGVSALIGGDLALAQGALSEARRVDVPVAQLREELDGGYQIARYAPPRMRHLGRLGYYAVAADQLDLAVRNTRVLARAAVTLVRDKGVAPGGLVEAILGLALAVEALAGYLEQPDHPLDVRVFALEAAGEATAVLETSNDLASSALVAQIRSTATDLLQASGMSPGEALEVLREGVRLGSRE